MTFKYNFDITLTFIYHKGIQNSNPTSNCALTYDRTLEIWYLNTFMFQKLGMREDCKHGYEKFLAKMTDLHNPPKLREL